MTIRQALQKFHDIEADLILSYILGKPKEFLYMNPSLILPSYHSNILLKLINRRKKGEPMAYVLGHKDFYGLRFKVNKHVLVPRPDTEQLVERVKLKIESLKQKNVNILDVGTGSGCIIVSIAKELEKWKKNTNVTFFHFYGSDISPSALNVARQNARHHKTKIKFNQSDLLAEVKFVPDIIAANLPYGWSEWKNNSSAETVGLKFEPRVALFTKEKGLYQIRRLLGQVAARKQKPKFIFLEFDPRQKQALNKLIRGIWPKTKVKFHRDLTNLWRFVEIKLPSL